MNPFINYTHINEHMEDVYQELDKESNIKLTPRWIAQTRIFNTERTLNTSSYMVAGDSIRERNIGIAPGFPIEKLERHELITTHDIANVLGLKIGDQI